MPRWRFLTWVILFFNALMLFLVIVGLAAVADNCDGLTGTRLESCETGTAVGATIGTGLIVFFWVGGSVILGLIWLVTNKKARDCPACGRHVKRGRTTCRKCGHDFAPAQTASPSIPPPPPPQTPSSSQPRKTSLTNRPPHPPKQPRLLLSLEPQPRPRHLWLVSLRSIRRSN